MRLGRSVASVGSLVLVASACSSPTPPSANYTIGPTVSQATAPPAIAGGTLLMLHDGATVVAADPDGDAVYAVDVASHAVRWHLALSAGDEPGRLAEDASGHVHVALRRGGAVASIDAATGALLARRAVCTAPRGIAFDPATGSLDVACASGELVTLPATGDAAPVARPVREDLRDVVVDGTQTVVTTFRHAEFVQLDPSLASVHNVSAPANTSEQRITQAGSRYTTEIDATITYEPDVAWRSLALPGGGVAMLHQRAESSSILAGAFVSNPSYYGGTPTCTACSCAVVQAQITQLDRGSVTPHSGGVIPLATLPVDLAVSNDARFFAVVAAANFSVPRLPEVLVLDASNAMDPSGCADAVRTARPASGQATSVAFDTAGQLVVQTRAPATLWFEGANATVTLDATDRRDTGHDEFHANSSTFIACASCHPEGGDDGHTWVFDSVLDPRRTIALRGGLLTTAPFHWRGELRDMTALMNDVFVGRMGAPAPAPDQVAALGHWLDVQPLPVAPPPTDAAAVARGQTLFNDPTVACATCHSGPDTTNNMTVDVGTGGGFQVPSLRGLRWRAPYMHNGCAATLADRFNTACGGTAHGHTAQLTSAERDDLIAYLQSL